ncbi:transcription factor S [Candidatus Pacearchaeota archaeon]|nr:transcription factor S [Candidatus Pacearchaeota archaeon]|tara:strand:+ start:5479 stop:5787 length:309 start_codon:yes stop_codon:yes gene_type:complete
MEFCPRCGAILVQKRTKFGCPRCHYISKSKVKIEIKEKINADNKVAVVKETEGEVKPIVEIQCPKCKNGEAYFWTVQTRAADESETKFYKCTKCKHTWRDYR